MKYDKIVKAIFIERPNRFIARVKIDAAGGGSDFGRLHRKESKSKDSL